MIWHNREWTSLFISCWWCGSWARCRPRSSGAWLSRWNRWRHRNWYFEKVQFLIFIRFPRCCCFSFSAGWISIFLRISRSFSRTRFTLSSFAFCILSIFRSSIFGTLIPVTSFWISRSALVSSLIIIFSRGWVNRSDFLFGEKWHLNISLIQPIGPYFPKIMCVLYGINPTRTIYN